MPAELLKSFVGPRHALQSAAHARVEVAAWVVQYNAANVARNVRANAARASLLQMLAPFAMLLLLLLLALALLVPFGFLLLLLPLTASMVTPACLQLPPIVRLPPIALLPRAGLLPPIILLPPAALLPPITLLPPAALLPPIIWLPPSMAPLAESLPTPLILPMPCASLPVAFPSMPAAVIVGPATSSYARGHRTATHGLDEATPLEGSMRRSNKQAA